MIEKGDNMKNKSFLLVLVSAISIFLYALPVSAEWKLDSMTSEIEKTISIAQKQAEIIIKMLNSEKHLQRIQEDINTLGKGNNFYNFKAKETYLYKALAKLNVPFEKTAISSKYLTDPSGRNQIYIQALAPYLIVGISTGMFNGGSKFVMAEDKDFFAKKSNAEKLAMVCEKLIAIQKPVQLLAREKLNLDAGTLRKFVNSAGGGLSNKSVKSRDSNASDVYSFLIPQNNVQSIERRVDFYLSADSVYLIYFKMFLEYLEEIGYGFDNGRGDWSKLIGKVNTAITKKAEAEDLGGLDSKEGQKGIENKETDSGLNLDDLKLPSK